MEVSGQLHTAAASPSGKEPPVSIGWEAGWDPEPVYSAPITNVIITICSKLVRLIPKYAVIGEKLQCFKI